MEYLNSLNANYTNLIIGFAIFCIICIIYIFLTWNTQLNEDYLYGSWLAVDDDFCETSNINSMQIFIGPAQQGWLSTTRNCYLVITNDIANTDFTITYKPAWTMLCVGKYSVHAKLTFSEEEQLFADDVTITIDIRDGTLLIKDNETIYAQLVKQNDITNLTRDMEDADMIE